MKIELLELRYCILSAGIVASPGCMYTMCAFCGEMLTEESSGEFYPVSLRSVSIDMISCCSCPKMQESKQQSMTC